MDEQEVLELLTNPKYNWELATYGGRYHLRQKDKHYMKTVMFDLSEDFLQQHKPIVHQSYSYY